jgi:hypothetical protein
MVITMTKSTIAAVATLASGAIENTSPVCRDGNVLGIKKNPPAIAVDSGPGIIHS